MQEETHQNEHIIDTNPLQSPSFKMNSRVIGEFPELPIETSSPSLRMDRREFPMFSLLPTEIRLNIWKQAALDARVLFFGSNVIKGRKNPVILQLNRESREEALKHYKLLFDGSNFAGSNHLMYFNPAIDTIRVNWKFKFNMMPTGAVDPPWRSMINDITFRECDDIRRLELHMRYNSFIHPHTIKVARNFKNLDRFVMCIQHPSVDLRAYQSNPQLFIQGWNYVYKPLLTFFTERFESGLVSRVPELILRITPRGANPLNSVPFTLKPNSTGLEIIMNHHHID